MNRDRWNRLSAAFEELCDLAPGEREARLGALAHADAELAAELIAMLAADARTDGALAGGPLALAAEAGAEDTGAVAPVSAFPGEDRIGPWRLIARLGTGGMGEVWAAERADGAFEQRVALKLLKRGMDSEEIVRRFLRERRILARLDHPRIARFFDGGTAPDGRPFFVLERVNGTPLTEYAERRAIGLDERLRLVIAACEAVAFAHRQLVVHRDLKPSNILVTPEGELKLLDFGIARLLEAANDSSSDAGLTRTEARVLTPAYAAPEQILGEPPTTATDVYGLGVILYELLTGRLPHRRRGAAADLAGALAVETIERPSRVVLQATRHDGADTQAWLPADRLARALRGDLDTIVLKALAREPERRYATAAALADDIERYRAGLPVAARPDTLVYRTRKFVRRHNAAVAAATTAVVLVALLTALYTVKLARERDRARIEEEKERQVAAFLTGLFELTDLDRTKGVRLSVRDIVDRGAANLERDLAGAPEVAASLMDLIGGVYAQLDLKQQALPLLEKALATRRHLLGDEHPETAASERELGALLHEVGDQARAAELLRHALKVEETTLGADSVAAARTRTLLAAVDRSLGDYAAAGAELDRAIVNLERAGATAEIELAQTLTSRGLLDLASGEPAAALPLFRRVLALRERLLGPASPATAAALLNLSAALRETGELDAAIAGDERVRDLAEKEFGEEHSLYAYALGELAMASAAKGDVTRARELYPRAIATFEKIHGPEDESTLLYRRAFATMLATNGDPRGALEQFSRILEIRERVLAPDHPRIAQSLFDLGRIRRTLGDLAGAEAAMRRSLAINRGKLAADSPELIAGMADLGALLCARGRREEGSALIEEALAASHQHRPPDRSNSGLLAESARLCGLAPAGG